jgi:hypothetical protein
LNLSRNILTLALICLSVLALSNTRLFGAQANPTAKSPPREQTPKKLEEAVQKFVDILEKGQPEDLLGIVSKDGVVFGIDSDPIPFLQIQTQIRQKKGVYCLLFDTDCLRSEELQYWKKAKHSGNIKAVISFREAIRSASSRKINVSPDGGVAWNLKLEGSPAEGNMNATTFGFDLELNTWKLTSIEYP